MNVQALSSRGYPSSLPDSGTAYARVRDGLRAFDAFGDEIRRRQNALQPPPASAHGSASASGHAVTATLGGALAAYLASEAGQKTLGTVAHAVVDFAKNFFEAGPEQLPLPLA